MGYYTTAFNKRNQEVAAIGHSVWNPNIRFLYSSLNLEYIQGWSGDGKDVTFSSGDIEKALLRIEKENFFSEVKYDELDPLVRTFTLLQQPKLEAQEEKARVERFLISCLKVAKEEGKVKINFD